MNACLSTCFFFSLVPGLMPAPVATYDYALIGAHPNPALYATPAFRAALATCAAPEPGYGTFSAPADAAVKCMDSHGYILVESFRPPRQ
jgi:hypothetical protein